MQRLTLLNLRSLSVFETQLAAMKCTKLLASKMHGGSLWLNREYPIHVDNIHCLTGLSAGGNEINTVFQAGAKRAKKHKEEKYYEKYGTERGKRGEKIDLINKIDIRFACYIIASKTMRHFAKNECTLDAILVTEHFFNGEVLNWSAFLLSKLFEACKDIYRRSTDFLFGHILMSLAMWKWQPLGERGMMPIMQGQPLALQYELWRTSGDLITKEVNEATFKEWYEMVLITIRST